MKATDPNAGHACPKVQAPLVPPLVDAAFGHFHKFETDGHGDVLQGVPERSAAKNRDQVQPVRIRIHEWRFCRAFVPRWPISFEQVRNVLAGLLWDVWACLGAIVQSFVQHLSGPVSRILRTIFASSRPPATCRKQRTLNFPTMSAMSVLLFLAG